MEHSIDSGTVFHHPWLVAQKAPYLGMLVVNLLQSIDNGLYLEDLGLDDRSRFPRSATRTA